MELLVIDAINYARKPVINLKCKITQLLETNLRAETEE